MRPRDVRARALRPGPPRRLTSALSRHRCAGLQGDWRHATTGGGRLDATATAAPSHLRGTQVTEDREQLLQHYRQTRRDFLAAIDGLADDLIAEPSLDGWAIKDHLAHVALWDDIRASEVARISAGFDSAWRMSAEQDNAFDAMAYELRRALSVDQARWEFSTSRQRLLDAISSATERGLDASLYGEAGLRSSHEVEHTGWIRRWRSERGL